MRNVPHGLRRLNPWFPASGAVWRGSLAGGSVMGPGGRLREWETSWRLTHCSVSCLWLEYGFSAMPATCRHASPPFWTLIPLKPEAKTSALFLKLLPVTCHENRKIANTSGKEFSQIHSQRVGRSPGLAERLFRVSQPQSSTMCHLCSASEAKGTCGGGGGGGDGDGWGAAPQLQLC